MGRDYANEKGARDEFGRAVTKDQLVAITEMTASIHKGTTPQEQHGDRYYYGNQNRPQEDYQNDHADGAARSGGGGGGGLLPNTVVRGKVVRIETYGAFVEFRLPQNGDKGPSYRGLVHISQMAPHRVEKVEDIVQMKQEVYSVILEVNGPPGREKIRLALSGVDQETGRLTQPIEEYSRGSNYHGGGGGGGAPPPPPPP